MRHATSRTGSLLRYRAAWLICLATIAGCMASQGPSSLNAAEGERRAKEAIAAGEPMLVYLGRYNGLDVDLATGLPRGSLGSSPTDTTAYQNAYNAVILGALDRGEIVAPYRDRLFSKDALRDLLGTMQMHPLGEDGGAAPNAEGEWSVVRVKSGGDRGACYLRVTRNGHSRPGRDRFRSEVILTPGGFILKHHGECDAMEVGYTHGGRTAVFRYTGTDRVFTYDLDHGRVMQVLWPDE